jgi:hypothetical protein
MVAVTAESSRPRPSGRTAWARNLAAPVRDFLNTGFDPGHVRRDDGDDVRDVECYVDQ